MATTPVQRRAAREQALQERGLIRSQMRLGTGLIAFGALSIPIFQATGVLNGEAATASFAVATAVIGAGAAMLPTGAAAGASARILRSLPDEDRPADDRERRTADDPSHDTALTPGGTGNGNGQPARR